MTALTERSCKPCEGGVEPMTRAAALALMKQLQPDWSLSEDSRSLKRAFKFKDFYRTMSFVNALAHIANQEEIWLVRDVGGRSDARPIERGGLDRCQQVAADDPAADLRSARVVDDRRPAATHFAEIPPPALRIPRLARRAQDAQGRQVVSADGLRAMRDEGTNDGWREAQVGHLVARGEVPQAIRTREIRRALVQDEPGAEQE